MCKGGGKGEEGERQTHIVSVGGRKSTYIRVCVHASRLVLVAGYGVPT